MKVTVLIPTYNYANYILEAIKSVENQTYPLELIEVIIIDDGSTDDTKQVIENYPSALDIKYIYQENRGKALATQLGIEKSQGEVIFNLDADDYFSPEKIERVISIYAAFPLVVSVGHPANIIYQDTLVKEQELLPNEICDKEIIGTSLLEHYLEKRILFGGGSTFSAKASALKLSTIFEGVDMYIDEYLIFNTYVQGNTFLLNSYLSVWRVHGENYSVESDLRTSKIKTERLLKSSIAMLEYIKKQPYFSVRIKELYSLKHLDRYYTSLESTSQKGLKEVLKLIGLIITKKYYFKDLKTYRIFNRFLPTFILQSLKLILNKN
jgi:glycosyltransferase involved in cell wall biosynthesis